jgi:hypothetical protein
VAFLRELLRVTTGEVRVFPLVDTAGVPYDRLDAVCADLAAHGVRTEVRRARCGWHPGADRMLVCTRS